MVIGQRLDFMTLEVFSALMILQFSAQPLVVFLLSLSFVETLGSVAAEGGEPAERSM